MIFEFFCVKTSYKTVSLSFQCFWPCFVTKLWPMPAVDWSVALGLGFLADIASGNIPLNISGHPWPVISQSDVVVGLCMSSMS